RGASRRLTPLGHNDSDLEPEKLGSERGKAIISSRCGPVLENKVLLMHVAEQLQVSQDGVRVRVRGGARAQDPYAGDTWPLLRVRGRPGNKNAEREDGKSTHRSESAHTTHRVESS